MKRIDPGDLAAMDRETLDQILPIGPRQIPVWFTCAWIGFVCSAVYGIALAWSLHESTYEFGPRLVRFAGRIFHFPTERWAHHAGSTWFVVLLNVLTALSLRKNLRSLRLVRGADKRDLVRRLFVADLRGLIIGLMILGLIGFAIYASYGQTRQFGVVDWVVSVYVFLWGFTQRRHPQGITTVKWNDYVPLVIRVGAIALFAQFGFLVLRVLASGLYLLFGPRGPAAAQARDAAAGNRAPADEGEAGGGWDQLDPALRNSSR